MSNGQIVGGVDFLSLSTHDLDAAMAFYGETLGLECSVHLPDRNYAEFETGNLTLSIIDGEQMGIGHDVSHIPLALHVDDVEEARAELEAKGVAFKGDVLDTGVCHMAFFEDPEGNALMLHHRYAPRASRG